MLGIDIILGSVTGLLGNLVTGFLKYKNQKMEFEHEQKMVALETAAMKEEAKMQIAVTKAEVEGEVELADAKAYMESLKSDQKSAFHEKWIDRLFDVQGKFGRFFAIPVAVFISFGFAFVEWLRKFMRPALSIYLTGMSTVITLMAWKIIKTHGLETMTPEQAQNIFTDVTSVIIYLTVSCVTWYFGDRQMSKAIVNMKKGNKEE